MEKNDIILHVDHMTKNFGDLSVLNDVSFDVHRGEFLCIVVMAYSGTKCSFRLENEKKAKGCNSEGSCRGP